MQRLLLALSVVILGLPAIAQADSWTGEDKYLHFTVSAGLGAAAYTQTHNRSKAFAWAMLPGVLKEITDSQTDGNNFSGPMPRPPRSPARPAARERRARRNASRSAG